MLRSRSFHTENITVELTLFPTYTILNENKNVIGRKAMTFERIKKSSLQMKTFQPRCF